MKGNRACWEEGGQGAQGRGAWKSQKAHMLLLLRAHSRQGSSPAPQLFACTLKHMSDMLPV